MIKEFSQKYELTVNLNNSIFPIVNQIKHFIDRLTHAVTPTSG